MCTSKISELDMHTHRFLWRDMNTSKPVVHYILKLITDKPGGPIAITVMKRIADMGS